MKIPNCSGKATVIEHRWGRRQLERKPGFSHSFSLEGPQIVALGTRGQKNLSLPLECHVVRLPIQISFPKGPVVA
jgi:hypothetical protein